MEGRGLTPQAGPLPRTGAPAASARTNVPPAVAPPPTANPQPPAPLSAPGTADLDPDNDDVVAPPDPIDDCEALLNARGISFRPTELPLTRTRRGTTCGSQQAVVYREGPGHIRYTSTPIVSCGMALALARFEELLQAEAESSFQLPVVRIEHGGTYSCRNMALYDMVSEHSYANAIDLLSFTLQNGKKISVLGNFGKLDSEPTAPEGRFLRNVARRAYDEGVFSVVLTPFFDGLHKNHFHVDLARYRVDGTR